MEYEHTSFCTYLALVSTFEESKSAARPNSSICCRERASTSWRAYCNKKGGTVHNTLDLSIISFRSEVAGEWHLLDCGVIKAILQSRVRLQRVTPDFSTV